MQYPLPATQVLEHLGMLEPLFRVKAKEILPIAYTWNVFSLPDWNFFLEQNLLLLFCCSKNSGSDSYGLPPAVVLLNWIQIG